MAYKRALWHSGLTYQQRCSRCQAVVRYMDDSLDFRAWYPNGFVYCPRCKNPIRHDEAFAIDAKGNYINPPPSESARASVQISSAVSGQSYMAPPAIQPVIQIETPAEELVEQNEQLSKFCTQCGTKLNSADLFCSRCGAKQ